MISADDVVEAIEERMRQDLNELVETGSVEVDLKIRVRATLAVEIIDTV